MFSSEYCWSKTHLNNQPLPLGTKLKICFYHMYMIFFFNHVIIILHSFTVAPFPVKKLSHISGIANDKN